MPNATITRIIKSLANFHSAGTLMILAALCPWQLANAQLKVSDSVIEMRANQSTATVTMSNSGPTALVVDIDLKRVVTPEDSSLFHEVTESVTDNALHAAPNNFTLAPNQSLEVKLRHSSRQLDTDDVYRVNVSPSLAESSQGMNIILNYNLLLFVRPSSASADVRVMPTGNSMELMNYGNSNVLISELELCDSAINQCHALPPKRLYANQRWPLPIPEHFDKSKTTVNSVQTQVKKTQKISYRLPALLASQ